MGNELQSHIDPCNLSGEFICNVESLYGTKQVSLLLYEKGMIKNYCLSTNYATCFKATTIIMHKQHYFSSFWLQTREMCVLKS